MAKTPSSSFRLDWLLVTLLVGATPFSIGRQWGKRAALSDAIPESTVEQRTEARIERVREEAETRAAQAPAPPEGELPLSLFFRLHVTYDSQDFEAVVGELRRGWRDGYAPMLLEIARFSPTDSHRRWVFTLLEEFSGQAFDGDFDRAWQWVWNQAIKPHPQYGLFKAALYQRIDPRFSTYFDDHTDDALIRLDEVRWGGVRRDGIPPLKNPEMIAADSPDAGYLADTDVVFGLEVNGDARAYPKRILAWHEMFKDEVGPPDARVSVNGVYCTLCGSMILYETVDASGTHHELGTSGFLYRSNKLMYDAATESIWSTLEGKPVIGPLVGQGIQLLTRSVVTTTWGEWKRQHPETTVLSLNTGHQRNYDEGVAYQSYFATDELMFTVPNPDRRLKNKAEVLALRFGGPDATPTVIDTELLAKHTIYQGELGGVGYVVFTTPGGANRVYATEGITFTQYDGERSVLSDDGRVWTLTEDRLITAAGEGATRPRLPAHRAFWFGWHAAHPDTILIR